MRFNLFGKPNAGKSTFAARLFSDLKMRNKSVEYVSEWIKTWAYEKRTMHKYDQLYVFAKQLHSEYRFLTAGVKNIVTDSPCLLSAIYSPPDLADFFADMYAKYNAEHPSINFYLTGEGIPYNPEGRWQTLAEANLIGKKILQQLDGKLYIIQPDEYQKMLEIALMEVD